MTIPVTTRLDDEIVDAIDRAVAAGMGANRGAIVSAAVRDWLDRHGEAAIVESYRRRYSSPDPEQDQLIADLASFSVAACLAVSER